jgi:hypothetical protein
MQALVDGVAALLQGEQPDVGILDSEQLQDALTHRIIFMEKEFPVQSFMPGSGVCRILHRSSLFAYPAAIHVQRLTGYVPGLV